MSEEPAPDRRVGATWSRAPRRGAARLLAGLYRTLAEDDDRAEYWIRHVRHGIVLTWIAGLAVIVYTLFTPTPGRHSAVLLSLASLAVVTSPGLLLLPLAAWMRDRRGPMLFYCWSVAVTVLVTVGSRIDGGPSSPLFSLLFLTLGFMAVTYPPYGVVLIGSLMTGSYLLFVALLDLSSSVLFFTVIMASFTMICAMVSANSWDAYDRQVALIRTHEALASTDPLTGCPNRRAFLDRLGGAIEAAAEGHQTAVCLIDLDGFKAVNDRDGHAAGDAALTTVTAALTGAVREDDMVARLGGDEFAVLAEVSASLPAAELAERLRDAVASAGCYCGVTASVGVVLVDPADDVNLLLHRADAAMYRAKTSGGNRVTVPAS